MNTKIQQLQNLINKMDLPSHRKTSEAPDTLRWLARNMGIRNSDHKNYEQARTLLVSILREQNLVSNKELRSIEAPDTVAA
ncbi:hypothetical protein [Ralstonia phage RP13]|nr:hypothetical protein [Ralstonia phage RP13]